MPYGILKNQSLAEELAGPHERAQDLRNAERRARSSMKEARARQKETGRTLLHLLPSSVYDERCVSRAVDLLEAGADVHARDAKGNTPLHAATLHGCIEYATLLVEMGADPAAANDAEDCPMELTPMGAHSAAFLKLWNAPRAPLLAAAAAAPGAAEGGSAGQGEGEGAGGGTKARKTK
jgi:ankyrin repeat protein